jgi:hypothetical protein
MSKLEEDFIPYGPEWEKAMMRLNKDFIIRMTKSALIERNALEARVEQLETVVRVLKYYGMIHTVQGVSYPEGTHQEFIDKADNLLSQSIQK